MAFEADCDSSRVLGARCVASTAWSPATGPSTTAPRRLGAPGVGFELGVGNS
jgi:hypothetical protein